MKKVLLGLLILAVAAGGAFAQGWTFNGMANGGIGIFISDADNVDPTMGSVSDSQLINAYLQGKYVNEDGTAGLTFRIRQRDSLDVNQAFGWVSFMDGIIHLTGGKISDSRFAALDGIWGDDMGEGNGLLTVLAPVDGFLLGFGAYAGASDALPGEDLGAAKLTFGAAYSMPDMFKLAAGFNTQNGTDPNPSAAYLSFAYLGLEGMEIAVTGRFVDLNNFSDDGEIKAYLTFDYSAIENLSASFGVQFAMGQNDLAEDIALAVNAGVGYEVIDGVTPGLNLLFGMGGVYDSSLNYVPFDAGSFAPAYNGDAMFVRLNPYVNFAVQRASFELGANVHVELGEEAIGSTWYTDFDTLSQFGADGVKASVYALVKTSF